MDRAASNTACLVPGSSSLAMRLVPLLSVHRNQRFSIGQRAQFHREGFVQELGYEKSSSAAYQLGLIARVPVRGSAKHWNKLPMPREAFNFVAAGLLAYMGF